MSIFSAAASVSRYLENCHFLVRAIYFPRVCAYLIATSITFWGVDLRGLSIEQAGLLFFLLSYPHIQLWSFPYALTMRSVLEGRCFSTG
jgi:hypothetical protein